MKNKYIEISYSNLLIHLLKKWRLLLWFLLAGILIMGGRSFYTTEKTMKSNASKVASGKYTEISGSQYKSLVTSVTEQEEAVKTANSAVTKAEKNLNNALNSMEETYTEEELETLRKKLNTQRAKLEDAQEEMDIRKQALLKKIRSVSDLLKSVVRSALIGGIGCLLAACFLVLVLYIGANRVRTGEEPEQMSDYPVLTVFNKAIPKKKNYLDKKIAALERKDQKAKDQALMSVLAFTVGQLTEEGDNILIVSMTPASKPRAVAMLLSNALENRSVSAVGNIETDPESAAALAQADHVILFVERDVTPMKEAASALKRAELYGCHILGWIAA